MKRIPPPYIFLTAVATLKCFFYIYNHQCLATDLAALQAGYKILSVDRRPFVLIRCSIMTLTISLIGILQIGQVWVVDLLIVGMGTITFVRKPHLIIFILVLTNTSFALGGTRGSIYLLPMENYTMKEGLISNRLFSIISILV